MTLEFNDGQTIDPATLSGIQITPGPDGTFYDPANPSSDTDDLVITPAGWASPRRTR